MTVLVHSGRSNKSSIDQMAYNNKNLFLTLLETEKSKKIKVAADLVSGDTITWLIDGHLTVSSSGGRG